MDPADKLLSSFSEEDRAEALKRFALLKPFLDGEMSLSASAKKQGKSIRTARRWLKNYNKAGLIGLINQTRTDSGVPKTPESVRNFVQGLALSLPRQSAATIHRRTQKFAAEQGLPDPSYTTVRDIISKIGVPLLHLAHSGKKSYSNKFDLIHRRAAKRSNEIWQADHTLMDIMLLDANGREKRPWLTVILDDHSRAICGYLISFEAPCALNAALALHQAIWRKLDASWHICGIPDRFYTDHGSDFTSQHIEQVAADLKMSLMFSAVGQPRGRGKLERFFGTVNQRFLCEQPGFTGGGGEVRASKNLAALDADFQKWVMEDYLFSIHGETNETPQSKWDSGGFLPRMPESLEQLDLLLLTVARPRFVHTDGIHFQNFRYMSQTLAAFVREEVTIRYDPRDLAQIRVFHQNKFLCVATCSELSGYTVSLKDIVHARNQRRKELTKDLKRKLSVVDLFVAAHQPKQIVETLENKEKPQKAGVTLRKYDTD